VLTYGAAIAVCSPDNVKAYAVNSLKDGGIVDTGGVGDAFSGGLLGTLGIGKSLDGTIEVDRTLGTMSYAAAGIIVRVAEDEGFVVKLSVLLYGCICIRLQSHRVSC